MYGFLLLIPFFLIRFGLLIILNQDAVGRAAHFAPMYGKERWAYWVYQISNVAVFIYLCFLKIRVEASWLFYAGIVLYILGLLLLAFTMKGFSSPSQDGMNEKGIYWLSRNPMYVSYFVCFIGCVMLTKSWLLLVFVLIFQFATHWIILSEEKWCMNQFGESYKEYSKRVRRYL